MTHSFETIDYAVDGDGIAVLTLNRPDRLNAFNRTMLHDVLAALDLVDGDDTVRALIVTGAGRGFCAGADLAAGGATFDYEQGGTGWNDAGSPFADDGSVDLSHPAVRDGGGLVALRLFDLKKPVIGAINGAAVGVGVTMTLPMDFRLASTDARFGFVFARRGIVPEAASSWFLPRLVGIGQALEWCYSGRVFGADEALKGGLVRSLHAPDALLPAARTLAIELTTQSAPASVSLTRRMLWTMLGAAHPMDAHRLDSRAIWRRGASADAKEGIAAFLAKRPAHYIDSVVEGWADYDAWFAKPEYR